MGSKLNSLHEFKELVLKGNLFLSVDDITDGVVIQGHQYKGRLPFNSAFKTIALKNIRTCFKNLVNMAYASDKMHLFLTSRHSQILLYFLFAISMNIK